MIDPAVIGTLHIGLRANRFDSERSFAVAATKQARGHRVPLRQRFAAAFRGMAARIEPAGMSAR